MGARFESEETTTLQVRRPLAGTVRRVIVLLLALWTGANSYSLGEIARNLSRWWLHERHLGFPIHNTSSLIVHLVAFGLVADLLLRWRRNRRPAAAQVRVDERGLFAGDVLVVAREHIASVEVTTDPDLGFSTVVLANDGASYVVPLRTERAAHDLAAALSPDHDAAKLVFEGLAGSRARETTLAVVAVMLLLGVVAVVHTVGIPHPLLQALADRYGDRPYTPLWWLWWAVAFAPFMVGGLASAPLARTLARRFQGGRLVVHREGVSVGGREIALEDIARVESGEGSGVKIGLKSGASVRAAFAADRPQVERDLFLARVRELIAAPPAPSYPSAETSGVRVALKPELDLDAAGEAAEEEPAEVRAARRR